MQEPVRPDYDGAWVGGVVPALLGSDTVPWLPAAVDGAEAVVLLVLDGVGWDAVTGGPVPVPELAAMEGGPITTVAPSTTAAALTSITTGVPPAEHGIVGYRMRVGGEVLNVLRWRLSDNRRGPDPAGVQPAAPFLGKPVPAITRSEFRETGFTAAQLRGSTLYGWRTEATLVEYCRRIVRRETFTYAYYDGLDKVAHEYGLTDGFYAAELAAVDRLVGRVLDALPPEAVLVVTADHGQVHVGRENVTHLRPIASLVGTYAGDGRFRYLHARPGAVSELAAAAQEHFGDVAWVFPRERLLDEGWLGRRASAQVRGRVGDVALAARTVTAFADPTDPKETRDLVSYHGSLTAGEMLVPLLAARGRG